MKWYIPVVCALALMSPLVLSGCGKSKAPEYLKTLGNHVTQVCACADKGCAEKVLAKIEILGERHQKLKYTETQQATLRTLGTQLGKCLTKRSVPIARIKQAAKRL